MNTPNSQFRPDEIILKNNTVNALFVAHAQNRANHAKIIYKDKVVSYGELNRLSDKLAGFLLSKNISIEDCVGVLMERSIDAVVSQLGILKAGGAYLPLSPEDFPLARITTIFDDARVNFVVTLKKHQDLIHRLQLSLGRCLTCCYLDGQNPFAAHAKSKHSTLNIRVAPDNLACVMYTSGSTGQPKGVMITHRNIISSVKNVGYVNFPKNAVVLPAAPTSFDANTVEIWGALLNGLELHIIPAECAMSSLQTGLTDRKLAHKVCDHNVFVSNICRYLPSILAADLVETSILPSLTAAGQAEFLQMYARWEPETLAPAQYNSFRIPLFLSADDVADINGSLSSADKAFLASAYAWNEATQQYHLTSIPNDSDNLRIANILHLKNRNPTEEGMQALSNLLENVAVFPKEDIFTATFNIPTQHPFFFEHAIEHVPGLMAIEAARQCGMACWHSYGNVPIEGWQFILDTLDSKFMDYIELSYRASIQATLMAVEKAADNMWLSVTFKIIMQQQGKICAEFFIVARAVRSRTFVRMRSQFCKINPEHRFAPVNVYKHWLTLRSIDNPTIHQQHLDGAQIVDLSMSGFRCEIPRPIPCKTVGQNWELRLFFEDLGEVRSLCIPVWHREEGGNTITGFKFLESAQNDHAPLRSIIKLYCKARQDRI